jgi:penicillin-binding protein 1C
VTAAHRARWTAVRATVLRSARTRPTANATAVALAVLVAVAWLRMGPLPAGLLDVADEVSTAVFDRNGIPLYEARTGAGLRATRLEPSEVPASLAEATIAAEDRRFRSHLGIDPLSVVRAAFRNLRAGRVVEGASTITQQAAKLLLERRARQQRPRGLRTKLEEAVVALRLEHRLGKPEILALYLSLAPYGNQTAGARRASEVYFGVSPALLTLAQSAFLAGLPQRPSAYNPYRNPAAAIARQRDILDRLVRGSRVSADEAAQARAEQLTFTPEERAFVAPHFVDMVLSRPGARRQPRIDTTLDARLQGEVVDIIAAHRDDLTRHGAHNVAVVVLENASGEWRAWEGSGNYDAAVEGAGDAGSANDGANAGGRIDGVRTLRQPGSALKPFTYALAFETGDTPATVLPDVAASYPTAQPGIVYSPRNYDGQFHGPLRARPALAGSQNVPAVELASRVGVPNLLRFLRAAGFSTFDRTASYYGLGVSLGNAEVSLAELVGGYAAFARGGVWLESRAVRASGAPESRRIMSPRAAFWVADILSDDEARAYVFGRGGNLAFPFTVAAKTGTSQAYRDNWTVGFTREVTVGVWVGNFDRRPLIGASGVTGAGPIFHAVMLAAQQHVRGREEVGAIVERPSDLAEHAVCELSGMTAGAACPLRTREWLPPGASSLPCSWHHESDEGLLTLWPTEYRTWAASQGLLREERSDPADARAALFVDEPRRASTAKPRGFQITSPPHGATYLIDPTLRPEFQTLAFKALASQGRVEWLVDGRRLGSTSGDRSLDWRLRRGQHVVAARDAAGKTAEVTITVK